MGEPSSTEPSSRIRVLTDGGEDYCFGFCEGDSGWKVRNVGSAAGAALFEHCNCPLTLSLLIFKLNLRYCLFERLAYSQMFAYHRQLTQRNEHFRIFAS